MKVNVGTIDRAARIVVGIVLIALAFTGTLGMWAYIGFLLLATGVLRTCPLYSILGVSTCPAKSAG